MRNIELKARLDDIAAAEEVAKRLAGPGPHATMRQVDTYFRVPDGRLKLREIEEDAGARAELIFYRRPDETGPKKCDYEIAPVAHPAELKRVLAAALGVRAIVDKQRTVYLGYSRSPAAPAPSQPLYGLAARGRRRSKVVARNVRIHLDRVEGLGEFIEFEAVMPDGAPEKEGAALVRELMEEFALGQRQLVGSSYVDLIEEEGGAPMDGPRTGREPCP